MHGQTDRQTVPEPDRQTDRQTEGECGGKRAKQAYAHFFTNSYVAI